MQKISDLIENYALEYINKYFSDVNNCTNIDEYYALLTSILVVKKLVVSSFKHGIETVDKFGNEVMSEEECNKLICDFEEVAEKISSEVISSFLNKNMN